MRVRPYGGRSVVKQRTPTHHQNPRARYELAPGRRLCGAMRETARAALPDCWPLPSPRAHTIQRDQLITGPHVTLRDLQRYRVRDLDASTLSRCSALPISRSPMTSSRCGRCGRPSGRAPRWVRHGDHQVVGRRSQHFRDRYIQHGEALWTPVARSPPSVSAPRTEMRLPDHRCPTPTPLRRTGANQPRLWTASGVARTRTGDPGGAFCSRSASYKRTPRLSRHSSTQHVLVCRCSTRRFHSAGKVPTDSQEGLEWFLRNVR